MQNSLNGRLQTRFNLAVIFSTVLTFQHFQHSTNFQHFQQFNKFQYFLNSSFNSLNHSNTLIHSKLTLSTYPTTTTISYIILLLYNIKRLEYYYDVYSSLFAVSITAPCNKIRQHCISFLTNIFNSIYKLVAMCYYIGTTLFTFLLFPVL